MYPYKKIRFQDRLIVIPFPLLLCPLKMSAEKVSKIQRKRKANSFLKRKPTVLRVALMASPDPFKQPHE